MKVFIKLRFSSINFILGNFYLLLDSAESSWVLPTLCSVEASTSSLVQTCSADVLVHESI